MTSVFRGERRKLRVLVVVAACLVAGIGVGAASAAPTGGSAPSQTDETTTTTPDGTTTTVPAGMCQGPSGLTICPGTAIPGAVPPAGSGFAPPATPGSGLDGLLRAPPDLRPEGLEPTFYERYSVGAYTIDSGPGTQNPGASGMNGMAGSLWAVALWILDAALKAFQWAFSLDLFAWLGKAVERIVVSLRAPIFESYVGVALAAAAAWAVWHGLVRRRAIQASEGIAWTVVALVIALIFLAKPGAILDGANAATTTVARGALGAVAEVSPDPDLDDGLGRHETYTGDAADDALRQTADELWRTAGYTPWAIMELGSMDVARDVAPDQELAPGAPPLTYGERLLQAKTFTGAELERLAAGDVTYDELRAEKLTELTELRDDLTQHHPDALPWLNGERAGERVGIAALALVAAIAYGGLILLVAGAVMVAQLGILVLAACAPLFLVLGVLPGRGRLVTMRWVELFISLVIKRVVVGVVLAVVLVLSGVLIASTASLGWGISIALQIGLVVCVFVYRKAFTTLFVSTSVPATALAGAIGTATNRSVARSSTDGAGRSFVAELRRNWASASARREGRPTEPDTAHATAAHAVLGSRGRVRRRAEATTTRDETAAVPSANGDGNVARSGNGSHPPDG
ncbi:MAG: hypothetical protein ACRD29_18900 [Acidimicrobiales bacterium]